MNLKDFVEIVLLVGNFVWAIFTFMRTQRLKEHGVLMQNSINSLHKVFDKEMELKLDSKRLSRDQVLKVMTLMDKLFDKLRHAKKDAFDEVHNYFWGELRQGYWEAMIYIPDEILKPISDCNASVIEAMNAVHDQREYWNLIEKASTDYRALIGVVRKTYHFESQDSKEIMAKMMKMIFDPAKPGQ